MRVCYGYCLNAILRLFNNSIRKWVDAHASLPSRARWIAKADVALRATKREASTLRLMEGFLLAQSEISAEKIKAYRDTDYRLGRCGRTFVLAGLPATLALGPTGKVSQVFRESRVDAPTVVGISGHVFLAKTIKLLRMLAPSPSPVMAHINHLINHGPRYRKRPCRLNG